MPRSTPGTGAREIGFMLSELPPIEEALAEAAVQICGLYRQQALAGD
ncbi:hypothetical protein [Streptomyces sp. NPDC002221]